jgi:hypothetical protein
MRMNRRQLIWRRDKLVAALFRQDTVEIELIKHVLVVHERPFCTPKIPFGLEVVFLYLSKVISLSFNIIVSVE